MKKYFIFLFMMCFTLVLKAQNETYAEKLGFPKGAKVVIMHVDDVGMSYDSNVGAIRAVEEGVATSMGVNALFVGARVCTLP